MVTVAHDGEEALALAAGGEFEVLVLDVMMPVQDGFAVVRALRDRRVTTPVLFLTARGEVTDRVAGLDAGGDDYLVKPFAFDELLARVRALGRRTSQPTDVRIGAGEIQIDLVRHEVRCNGEPVDLAPTEFRLLEYFLRHPGHTLSRRSILSHVWGYDADADANVVDLYVHYLRRKLGAALPLTTIRGVGYRLDATP